MKHLVIAEKPSVGRDIARVLHCNKKTNTYIEGTDYIVTWALGHLVTLADPEQYDEQYKTWNMDTLPMLPEHWKLVVIKQTGRQFHAVKELIFRKDVSDIIIATDAGREGELVARWILDKAGNQKPLKRLWISSVTDKAIREGFQNLDSGSPPLQTKPSGKVFRICAPANPTSHCTALLLPVHSPTGWSGSMPPEH